MRPLNSFSPEASRLVGGTDFTKQAGWMAGTSAGSSQQPLSQHNDRYCHRVCTATANMPKEEGGNATRSVELLLGFIAQCYNMQDKQETEGTVKLLPYHAKLPSQIAGFDTTYIATCTRLQLSQTRPSKANPTPCKGLPATHRDLQLRQRQGAMTLPSAHLQMVARAPGTLCCCLSATW